MKQDDDSTIEGQTDAGATRVSDDATRLRPSRIADEATRRATSGPLPPEDATYAPTRLARRADDSPAKSRTNNPDLQATSRLNTLSEPPRENPFILQPGSLIKNRFLLVDELGRGGMGVVYSARDLVHEEAGESDSWVAIKLLSDNFKDHPEALRMLQQETKKSRELAHPNVVTVYDFDRDGDLVYMTMELLSVNPSMST